MHFCPAVRFKTLKSKNSLTQKIFVEKHIQLHKQEFEKFDLNI